MADTEKTKKQEDESKESATEVETSEKPTESKAANGGKTAQIWKWPARHKKVSIPAAFVLLFVVLATVPFTRYAIASLFWKQDITVVVKDSQTKQPVSSALVTFNGVSKSTDNKGTAKLHVPVGAGELSVTKLYYKTTKQTITATLNKPKPFEVVVEATGRPVPLTVINKISGKPLENAVVKAEKTQAKTDKNGQVTMVLPADKTEVDATISGQGYNDLAVKIKVTSSEDSSNKFSITPAGKLYYLSNASGKLDVVKSDLDGANRQTVVAGTGKEDKNNTVLLASRDWKYIALYSKRDGGDNPKIFLLETDTDKLSNMDEGDATFGLVGWSGDRFIYSVTRNNIKEWQPKRQALKSFQASTKKITLLEETYAEGDQSNYSGEFLGPAYILNQEVVYVKNWSFNWSNTLPAGKPSTFNSVKSDGSQKKIIKGYVVASGKFQNIDARPGDFGEVYVRYYNDDQTKQLYDEYENGKIASSKITTDEFYGFYPNYIVSPTDKRTLWADFRDGKNVMFVGDESGENGKQIGASEDYNSYGWYTDDYVLVTKKGSEMHIMPAAGLDGGLDASLKISDYYKPNYLLRGYGYGYGG
jgi:hypothetical protein